MTNPDGTVLHSVKVKDEDYFHEKAGLILIKSNDVMEQAEFRA